MATASPTVCFIQKHTNPRIDNASSLFKTTLHQRNFWRKAASTSSVFSGYYLCSFPWGGVEDKGPVMIICPRSKWVVTVLSLLSLSSNPLASLKALQRQSGVAWLGLNYPLGGSNSFFITCSKAENAFSQMSRFCRNTGIMYALHYSFCSSSSFVLSCSLFLSLLCCLHQNIQSGLTFFLMLALLIC